MMTNFNLLLINPNSSDATTALMERMALPHLPAGWRLRCLTAGKGPAMLVDEAALALAGQEVLAMGLVQSQKTGDDKVDLIIVAAFGNPGMAELRSQQSLPVVGIGEASMREAAAGGQRFGIATTTPGLLDSIRLSVDKLGLLPQFSGTRIPAADPLVLLASPAEQRAQLALAVALCIEEDGAQAVVIGGGPLSQTAAELSDQFAVPVISPVVSAMQEAVKILACK